VAAYGTTVKLPLVESKNSYMVATVQSWAEYIMNLVGSGISFMILYMAAIGFLSCLEMYIFLPFTGSESGSSKVARVV
jgi:hypothetical protein